MSAKLSKSEWGNLKSRYHFSYENNTHSADRFIYSRNLLNKELCETYLDSLASEIGSPSRRVTASMLAKRYAFLVVAPVLYAMTVYDKNLLLKLDNCRLVSPSDSEFNVTKSKFPNLSFEEPSVTEPVAGKRKEWRDHVLRQLFAEHISPLFHALSLFGGIPLVILWENVMVRMAPIYEDGLEEETNPAILQRLHEDFTFITQTAPGSIFGERRNPFTKFMSKTNIGTMSELPDIRQTCCFYYEMSSAEYCRACPKPLECHK
ncbi:IucA/IucC family C-terminal-domain containing protein [Bacillus sp. FJAT-28004]|uniref:IucA/IucC family C-terminal-domain containing protein n=1 Tax=Bacillus sp. FJAT-28004 TaxID=1679165 RepID=UPI0006B4F531|nr:IucA/IucC family C-terminal-domain containing protein [Bacillus sp. FJAT-28004]